MRPKHVPLHVISRSIAATTGSRLLINAYPTIRAPSIKLNGDLVEPYRAYRLKHPNRLLSREIKNMPWILTITAISRSTLRRIFIGAVVIVVFLRFVIALGSQERAPHHPRLWWVTDLYVFLQDNVKSRRRATIYHQALSVVALNALEVSCDPPLSTRRHSCFERVCLLHICVLWARYRIYKRNESMCVSTTV